MRVGARPGVLQGGQGDSLWWPSVSRRGCCPLGLWMGFLVWSCWLRAGGDGVGGCRRWRSGLRWSRAVEQVLVRVRRPRTEERKELCV